MKIEIWSDVVCPWCYIGKRRLEEALADYPGEVELEWHSFELDPSAPVQVEGALDELLAKKYRTSLGKAREMIDTMTEAGAAEGIEFRFDKAQHGNTFDAHRLLQFAKQRGQGDAMKERLMLAYFTEGAPISDHATLAALAAEAIDCSVEQALEVLSSERFGQEVRHDELQARQMGVSGVPFFVFGEKYAVPGAQPAETLKLVLQQVQAKLDEALSCDEEGCQV